MSNAPAGSVRADIAGGGSRSVARPGQDAVTALLGAWLIGALFADGWAHLHAPELESFFTAWHLGLYSAFAALTGWFAWLGRSLRAGRFELPIGYSLGALGAAVFAVGGVADLAWHQAFGIEAGIDALVSPSHLILFAGGMLILTCPLRSAWARGEPASTVRGAGHLPSTLR